MHKQIRAEHIGKEMKTQGLFSGISFHMHQDERIALVGPNGAGKSTLMKLIAGLDEPTHGHIHYEGNLHIGYLAQVHPKTRQSIYDLMQESFPHTYPHYKQMKATEDNLWDPKAYETWEKAMSEYENMGGYKQEIQIEKVLTQLMFPQTRWHQNCDNLSGGERVRLAFGQILCHKPDFLLLDEPTNFLDLESIQWMESFLYNEWKGGFLIVSHDRYFLDTLCPQTWDLEPKTGLTVYQTNYTGHLEMKYKDKEKAWKRYIEEQEFLKKEKDWINKFRAGSRASQAKSREHALQKRSDIPKPYTPPRIRLRFEEGIRSNEELVKIPEAMIGYEENPLFEIEELSLRKGQRIGIMGRNGSGKSTLLKNLLGHYSPLMGDIIWRQNIQMQYYSQTHEHLDESLTLYQHIEKDIGGTEEEIRALLWAFEFKGDNIHKTVGKLSGGERSRLALAILSRRPSNLLIMDEPTNHLDYRMRESLENALKSYHGTVVFVSHDRYFINKIATHLWVIENGRLQVSTGNYDDWLSKGKRFDDRYKTEDSMYAEEALIRIDKLGEEVYEKRKWNQSKS